ncbi:hypothetical protein G6F59_017267 [Rhizopus arrhizus]|nr:hypothetical protein G6F59_017267 [Rhizopus arrhizus]
MMSGTRAGLRRSKAPMNLPPPMPETVPPPPAPAALARRAGAQQRSSAPLDPGQRTLRCPHVGATRPQRHEGGGRSRLGQRHASGGG